MQNAKIQCSLDTVKLLHKTNASYYKASRVKSLNLFYCVEEFGLKHLLYNWHLLNDHFYE